MQAAVQNPVSQRGVFATTQWGLVRAAGNADASLREQALETLLIQYRPALCEHLKRKYGLDDHAAEDVVQGFILDKVLRKNLFARARSSRGKFRSFLATSLRSYLTDLYRRQNAQTRRPSGGLTQLSEAMERELVDPADESSQSLDEAIVLQLIAEALHETRKRCTERGIPEAWEIFNSRILRPIFDQGETESYKVLAERHQLKSDREARNKTTTAKRIFQQAFRSRVAAFSADSEETEEEMGYLSRLMDGPNC